jgi:hypothetical protein
MKNLLVGLALLGGMFALGATEASAAVCARGVYRAGCAGPRGGWSREDPWLLRAPYALAGSIVRAVSAHGAA